MDFSSMVFLGILAFSFGFMVGNARNFGFWKFVLMLIFVGAFANSNFISDTNLIFLVVTFLLGVFAPHLHLLSGISHILSNIINAFRYRDAYADIKRREEEVEELRRQYERQQSEQQSHSYEQEKQRRADEAQRQRDERQRQKEQEQKTKNEDNHKNERTYQEPPKQKQQREDTSSSSDYYSPEKALKDDYCKLLGINPSSKLTKKILKQAYRKMASKFHPDKHHDKSAEVQREMTRKFQEVDKAFKWLMLRGLS